MAKSMRRALLLLLMAAIGLPALAFAQAVPRGSGGSSSAPSGGSGGESESYTPPPPPPPPPSRIAPEGARVGSAVPRGQAPPPSSVPSSSGVTSQPQGTRVGPDGAVQPYGGANDPRSRDRGNRFAIGQAVPRQPGTSLTYPQNGFPWYGSGLNWGLGYYTYSPFLYGSAWGRYGFWYNPYDPYDLYSPYAPYGESNPWLYGAYSGYAPSAPASRTPTVVQPPTGSLRLRIKPAGAKVYLDGTLMGTVDQFNGLTTHLAATAGSHELAFRADGYATLTMTVTVEEGKTITERGSLKRADTK